MAHDRVQKLLTVDELQEMLGIGRTKAYSLVTSGEIPSIRIGSSIRIDKRDLDWWLARHTYSTANK
jgi:excisionase family DNA binding protein